jgi:nicotinamidase-related amidase
MPFLMSTIPHMKRLGEAFRRGGRPVVYVTQVLRPDYSDAAFPYWRADLRAAAEKTQLYLDTLPTHGRSRLEPNTRL